MKKALITGIFGQDGAYLADFLLSKGYKVTGGARRSSQDVSYRLRLLGIDDKVDIVNFDLSDPYSIIETIKEGQFDEVYNLAAQSFVGASWDLAIQTSQVNGLAVLSIVDAIKKMSPETKFYQASTSEMFGKVQAMPQTEETKFYPRSPYGVSKLFAHEMVKNYRESFNLFLSNGILFNHESPLRGTEFVTKKIAQTLAQIKKGTAKTLQLGNLNAKRDWGFAPEYVQGMYLMMQHEKPDDFVLATGSTITVREFVVHCAKALNLDLEWSGHGVAEVGRNAKTGNLIVEVNEKYFRPAEVDLLVGDATKASTVLGWNASTYSEKLAEKMVKFEWDVLNNEV